MKKKKGIKTSRKSFIGNYILGITLLLTLFSVDVIYSLNVIVLYLFVILAVYLFLEPEFTIIYSTYFIEEHGVTEVRGIISKKQESIPWHLLSHRSMNKSILGRIFDFGDIILTSASGPQDRIFMKGVSNPEKILKLIEHRMSKHNK